MPSDKICLMSFLWGGIRGRVEHSYRVDWTVFPSSQQKQAGKLLKKTAKEEQAQVTMEMISLRQSGDQKDMASATHSLPDVSILINTLKPQAAFSPSLEA